MSGDESVLWDEFALSDAAYVLDALSPDERVEYEIHLQGCAACASSLAQIAGLPALMSTASVEVLSADYEPVPVRLPPSQARDERHPRWRRSLAACAAAASLIAVGAVGAVVITRPDSPTSPLVAPSASPTSGTANLALAAVVPSPVTASARLVDVAWGTRIDLTCAYRGSGYSPANGIPYAMVVIDRSGAVEQVATWNALPDRELTVMGATSQARRDIAAVEIRTLSGRAILRLST